MARLHICLEVSLWKKKKKSFRICVTTRERNYRKRLGSIPGRGGLWPRHYRHVPRAPTCKGGPNLAKKKILMTRMGPLYDKCGLWGPWNKPIFVGSPPPCKIGGPQTRVCLGAPKGVNPPLSLNAGQTDRWHHLKSFFIIISEGCFHFTKTTVI